MTRAYGQGLGTSKEQISGLKYIANIPIKISYTFLLKAMIAWKKYVCLK